jgi:hypothetical protein
MAEWDDERLTQTAHDLLSDDDTFEVFEDSSSIALNWLIVTNRHNKGSMSQRITQLRARRPEIFRTIDQRMSAQKSNDEPMIVLIADTESEVHRQTPRHADAKPGYMDPIFARRSLGPIRAQPVALRA